MSYQCRQKLQDGSYESWRATPHACTTCIPQAFHMVPLLVCQHSECTYYLSECIASSALRAESSSQHPKTASACTYRTNSHGCSRLARGDASVGPCSTRPALRDIGSTFGDIVQRESRRGPGTIYRRQANRTGITHLPRAARRRTLKRVRLVAVLSPRPAVSRCKVRTRDTQTVLVAVNQGLHASSWHTSQASALGWAGFLRSSAVPRPAQACLHNNCIQLFPKYRKEIAKYSMSSVGW